MATHSSILAWGIPQTKELVGYSPWGRRVGQTELLTLSSLYSLSSPICTLTHFQGKVSFMFLMVSPSIQSEAR